tara:strand:- start:2187 stop:4076 length:1890 start_codon:yes stop_codon:yes gene_type:complete
LEKDPNSVKKWILPAPIEIKEIVDFPLNLTLQKVLARRGITLEKELLEIISPPKLPNFEEHFTELNKATDRIIKACDKKERIAICGDYDADGITSTVLLIEILTILGAEAIAFIPSRMDDGYGLNIKMVDKMNEQNIKLAITVDNGISAQEAIERTKELNIDLIITDHHKIPNHKLSIYSLIHPEKTPENSPYRYLAGVGIAYLIAQNICLKLGFDINKSTAKELFCIGTIADMAPLKGANRIWMKEFLPKIKLTNNMGLKAIIKKLFLEDEEITTEDIGYKIAPVINAVGRINDPNLIIKLLTNKSTIDLNKLASDCIKINKKRRKMTSVLEEEAIKIVEKNNRKKTQFLVISEKEWHSGIIGIVAARILDKYNKPTAILSGAKNGLFRGSVRSNNLIKVNKALSSCKSILISYGGHSSAGGFTIKEENIKLLEEKLNMYAKQQITNNKQNKTINPEAHISFRDINFTFYDELSLVGPFGVENQPPIFWTRKCRVINLNKINDKHIKLLLKDKTGYIHAIRWNNNQKLNINDLIDIAFYIEKNKWKGQMNIQLNIVDIKHFKEVIELYIHDRSYKCKIINENDILITNSVGKSISSNKITNYTNTESSYSLFAKKIFSLAKIALAIAR